MEKKPIITEEGRRRVIAACGDGDYHQAIMDVVYEDWNKHNDALLYAVGRSGEDTPIFVGTREQCSEHERSLSEDERVGLHINLIDGQEYWDRPEMLENAARLYGTMFKTFVQLGNYNYQVCNGGHHQYFDNGYASGGGGCFQQHDPECVLHNEMLDAFKEVVTDNTPEEFKEIILKGRSVMAKFHITVDTERYDEEDCDACSGYGTVDCEHCGGNGVVEEDDGSESTCPECGGRGTVTCDSCDGRGHVEVDNENYGYPDNLKSLGKLDSDWYEINDEFMAAVNAIARKIIVG